jgi:predicted enzyme related to lactoylglutathione lyase
MGTGVFNTDDCQATYDELKGRGVEFLSPPTDRFYGIEALFKDNSGNWVSLTQHN